MSVKLFQESTQISFVAPDELAQRAKEDAARGDRNVSAQMRIILREYYRMVDAGSFSAGVCHLTPSHHT